MIRFIALILSILIQFLAAFIAFRLTKVTKYKVSWILISLGLLLMAIRRLIELIEYYNGNNESINFLNDWLAVAISILTASGVLIIPEIFNYMKKVEKTQKIAERRVLNAILRTEEKERERFAKDLHDGLGPLLSSVKMSLSALSQNTRPEGDTRILINTENTVDEAIKSIKEIANNLSPSVLNHFGLASSIKSFTEKMTANRGIEINFNNNIARKRFSRDLEVILYRTVCEMVNNTIKHAAASNISIAINLSGDTLELLYDDDGKGFDLDKQLLNEDSSGMGLQNMISRIKSLNGYTNLESKIGNGFKAYISIKTPININDET